MRYGQQLDAAPLRLGQLPKPSPHKPPTPDEAKVLADLSRAGTRLRVLPHQPLQAPGKQRPRLHPLLERHILRNFIFLHAIENDLPLPIGTQDMGLLDTWANDQDSDLWDRSDSR